MGSSMVEHVILHCWTGWPLVGNEGPSTFTLVYWGFMNPHSLRVGPASEGSTGRKHARVKYTVEDFGPTWFKAQLLKSHKL